MSIRVYNHETERWEKVASLLAHSIKLIDADGNFKDKDIENALRQTSEEIKTKIDWVDLDENGVWRFYSGGVLVRVIGSAKFSGGNGIDEELRRMVGDLSDLETDDKETIVGSINEVKQRVDILEGGLAAPEISCDFEGGEVIFATDSTVKIHYFLKSLLAGLHTLTYSIGAKTYSADVEDIGNNSFIIPSERLTEGVNNIRFYVTNKSGYMSNEISFKILFGALSVSSDFQDQIEYEMSDNITIKYFVKNINDKPLTAIRTLDGNITRVSAVKGDNFWEIGNLNKGSHRVSIQITDDEEFSNTIKFTIMVSDSSGVFLAITADKSEYTVEDRISIPYRISSKLGGRFIVVCYINEIEVQRLSVGTGTHFWEVGYKDTGEYKLQLYAYSELDQTKESDIVSYNITVSNYDEEPVEEIKRGLIARFSGKGKNNNSLDKEEWINLYGNKDITCELHNFNFKNNGNGWEDDALVINGDAYAIINHKPFADNILSGITIDILYEIENTGDVNAMVLKCMELIAPYKGLEIGVREVKLTSSAAPLTTPHIENTLTRATITINRITGWAFIYMNGVICAGVRIHSGISYQHNGRIYLGCNLGRDNEAQNFGSCKIKELRLYNVALTHEEVLQNTMADKLLRDQKIIKLRNDDELLPRVYMKGNMFGMGSNDTPGVDESKEMNVTFEPKSYPQYAPFVASKSRVDWQGSSSLYYEVKNYNIDIFNDFGVATNVEVYPSVWVPHDSYHMKANMVDSSHAYNIGMAKFVEWLRKKTIAIDPANNKDLPSVTSGYNPLARATVDGFPILMYIWDTDPSKNMNDYRLWGVYTFNWKQHRKLFGLEKDNKEQWLYRAETNSNAGSISFRKWGAENIDIITYPATGQWEERHQKTFDNHEPFSKFIEWVATSSNEEFVREINKGNRINKNSMMDYWLIAYFFGMSDSMGKNLSLASWGKGPDGNNLWYCTFYDMDTHTGFNNEGVYKYTPDMDYPGTGDNGFNTKDSLLWNRMLELFDNDVKNRYYFLRNTCGLNMDSVRTFFIDHFRNIIGEKFYNLDMLQKYVPQGDTYLAMAKGNRVQHIERWMTERMHYVDSILGFQSDIIGKTVDIRTFLKGDMIIEIETFIPIYVTILNDKQEGQKIKCGPGSPGFFKFEGDGSLMILHIDCAPMLKSIKGLNGSGEEGFDITMLDISQATRITDIECRDNYSLQQLVTTNCTNLRTVDLRGSMKVIPKDRINTINLAGCVNITDINLSDTNVQELIVTPTIELPGCKNIRHIDVSSTLLTTLDLTDNLYIETIEMNDCQSLSILKLSGCYHIKNMDMENSKLSELHLYECFNLETLNLRGSANLYKLVLEDNKKLRKIDLSECTSLTGVDLGVNKAVEELIIDGCSNIEKLNISNTAIAALSLEGLNKLKELRFSNTLLTSLDLSPCYNSLETINASNSALKSIDLRGCSNLRIVFLGSMPITEMPIENISLLTELDISNTLISSLNLSSADSLFTLNISGTRIENLDLSRCPKLFNIVLSTKSGTNNVLRSLDISGSQRITNLNLHDEDYMRCSNLKILKLENTSSLSKLKACTGLLSVSLKNSAILTKVWTFNPEYPDPLLSVNNMADYSVVMLNGTRLNSDRITELKAGTLQLTGDTYIEILDGILAGTTFFLDSEAGELPSDGININELFKDGVLAEHIRELTGKNSVEDKVTQAELNKITWIGREPQFIDTNDYKGYFDKKIVSSFNGIDFLKKLKYINLAGCLYEGGLRFKFNEIESLDFSFADMPYLTGVTLEGDTSKLRSISYICKDSRSVQGIIIPDASNLENASYGFLNCLGITNVVADFNNNKIKYINGIFKGCVNLNSVIIKPLTPTLLEWNNCFEGCVLDNVRFMTDNNVTKMSEITLINELFNITRKFDMSLLPSLSEIDIEGENIIIEELNLDNTNLSVLDITGEYEWGEEIINDETDNIYNSLEGFK